MYLKKRNYEILHGNKKLFDFIFFYLLYCKINADEFNYKKEKIRYIPSIYFLLLQISREAV